MGWEGRIGGGVGRKGEGVRGMEGKRRWEKREGKGRWREEKGNVGGRVAVKSNVPERNRME